MEKIEISIYDSSHRIAFIVDEPKRAWAMARSYVRAMAHADGVHGAGVWFTTANRNGYAMGIFRALPTISDRS